MNPPPFFYAKRTALDGRIVAFSRKTVTGNTPPNIAIDKEWWNQEGGPIPTEQKSDFKVFKLQPGETSIPEVATGAKTTRLTRACITPLLLAHPLLTAPYLSPAAAYTLLSAKVNAWKWDAPLEPLLTWLRASLYRIFPGVTSLPPLELAYHITVSRQTLQIQMVPRIPAGPAAPTPTYIIQNHPAAQAALAKKKDPAERWDLQAPFLYRLANVQGPEDLPKIWKTLAPLTKEKARPAFKIACRESARALRCKATLVTHTVAFLLLGLHFRTEDPDCVKDTVNI